MSQKAIKKRSSANHKKGVQIAVQPLINSDNFRTVPKPLPLKSFPLNKFIALPEGLRPRSSQSSEESSSPRRSTPIKAVAVPSGTSLSDSRAHLYIYNSQAQGDERSPSVTSEVLQGDDNSDPLLYNNSQPNLHVTPLNGVVRQSRREHRSNVTTRPDATSTPRPDRRPSPSPSHGYYNHSSQNSTRSNTPNGSITSVESVASGRKPRYQKRSQSAPPENNRRALQDTDFILQNWDRVESIPGLTKEITFETVQDGVSIQRENWTSANIGVSPNGVRHTIYRSNSINSGLSINTNTSLNTYTTGSSPDTSLDLEFTDVCNFNRANNVDTNNVSVNSLNFARSDTYFTGEENLGFNRVSATDNHSIQSVNGIKSSQSDIVPQSYKIVRSHSDINLTSHKMDENRNMAQLSMPKHFMANGAPQTGIVIYKHGTGERILVNDVHNHSPYSNQGFLSVGRRQGTLMQSKAKFSSMPSLADSKGDKKLMKLLKKQEKEERKRREKEEKKRAKEEKKRLKMEKKLKTKTLPRNFQYQQNNGSIMSSSIRDKVFRRPLLTLSAVPIDFEDGPGHGGSKGSTPAPKVAPPPPPMAEPSKRTMSLYSSAPDLLRLEQVYGATLRGVPKEYSIQLQYNDYGPRTVVLQRASAGYGFVLRGAKSQLKPSGELDFRPTPEFPALQYLDSIDPGSVSDKAGLKAGDFILEINGENVVRASHDRVVHLIRGTGDTLAMKVVTVKPGNRSQDWFQQDKSLTMPNRKKKAAPAPPQRDPRTSLSVSKSEGQSISEELAVMETLDKAIRERKNSEETNKTASIRSRTAAKRVSCVELENIGVTSNLERSKSTPDLLDGGSKRQRDIYATPTVPDKGHVYAVPIVNTNTPGSPSKLSTRPKGPPPAPPSETGSPKKQAPKPPQAEVISIDTRKQSPYASAKIYTKNEEKSDSLKQSTFRPVSDDSGSEKSFGSATGHRHTASNGDVVVTQDQKASDKQGVSFAEDKVFDSAATFLRKHPNAKLLITANEHPKLRNTNSLLFEPEPDYDTFDDKTDQRSQSPIRKQDNRQSVTVISVGNQNDQGAGAQSHRYTIHSTIPTEDRNQAHVIPPRPDGPAPSPPRQMRKSAAPAPPLVKSQSETPPPLPETPPPDFDKSPSPRDAPEVKLIQIEQEAAAAPPPPPPPPPPPVPSMTELEKTKTDLKPEITPIPFTDIAAAVAKRQERIEKDGPKFSSKPGKQLDKPQTAKETNQAAILAAVEKRRKQLEQKTESSVVDEIESRLQKTKKLQAAKFNISGSKGVVKSTEVSKPVKSETVVSQSGESKVNAIGKLYSVKKTDKTVIKDNVTKPKELSFTVKPASSSKNTVMTEITPKIVNAKQETKQVNGTTVNKKPEPVVVKQSSVDSVDETSTETNKDKSTNGQSDFLALAEKKRQEYLSRKNKTPPGSRATTPRSSTTVTPELFRPNKTIEIKPLEKKGGSPPVSAKPKVIKGATTTQSYTEYQSPKGPVKVRPITAMNGDANKHGDESNVPPPPMEFRDGKQVQNTVVQLEIIPPPSNFTLENGPSETTNQHSPAFSPDTASVVSSLSTLSSLSGDHDGRGGYEDLIAPPPPGFDDGDAIVIPPPPEFGNDGKNMKNSMKSFSDKPVELWLCNDVLDWLDSLNMNQYKSSFQQNCIDGKKLLSLTRNNYIDLGVTQVGHRMNIERSIKKAAIKQSSSNIIASEHL